MISSACGGNGKAEKTVSHDIRIPKGVDNGSTLRIEKMGHGSGDLLVEIRVGTHNYFKREGYDIHTSKLISISQAVLGATIDVVTLYGKQKISVKPGTTQESVYRIASYGVQKLYPNDKFKGDHYVHFKLHIPQKLNRAQKEAMKSYAAVEEPVENEEHIK